jgi:hypothetical protein
MLLRIVIVMAAAAQAAPKTVGIEMLGVGG